MNTQARNDLINTVAKQLHDKKREQELRDFHTRYLKQRETVDNPSVALSRACMKDGKKQNEIYVDGAWAGINSIGSAIRYFDRFKELVDDNIIEIQSYFKRKLTPVEEFKATSEDYRFVSKEENILRPFKDLSADSKKEFLAEATKAVSIYEEYAKRGAVIEQYSHPKASMAVGTLLHAEWMKENDRTVETQGLFVPYEKLGKEAKIQELDAFRKVIAEVEQNPTKYSVEVVQGLEPINPKQVENSVLAVKNPDMALKNER